MEEDIFKENLLDVLQLPDNVSFTVEDMISVSNQDYFFVAKWDEVLERYLESRRFVEEALQGDWKNQFSEISNNTSRSSLLYRYKSDLYEMALISYNILVDLTWTWTYVSAEYVLYSFDEQGNIIDADGIYNMCPIEEANNLFREVENIVSSPTAQNNPFGYLKSNCPDFSEAIDTIIDFWKNFSDSNIRKLYNYIKHRGKPRYKEIKSPGKLFRKYMGNEECVSDINDIQITISVDEGLQELINFDNEELLPYVKTLLNQLKIAVDPSPAAYV